MIPDASPPDAHTIVSKDYTITVPADAAGPAAHELHVGAATAAPMHDRAVVPAKPPEMTPVSIAAPLLKLFYRFQSIALPFAARCEGIPLDDDARLANSTSTA